MARKKIEPEEKQPKTRVVEAITTRKWKEPITVPIETVEIEEDEIIDPEIEQEEEFEFEEVEEARPRRTPAAATKGKFKDALNFMGIGNKEIATLRIDRLLNYKEDGNESFRNADSSFVDKIQITPAEIKEEKHLIALKKYGPGVYRLTLRHGSTNLGIWKEKIDGPEPVARTEGGGSSQSPVAPHIIQQSPALPPKSFIDSLEEIARVSALMDKIRGNGGQSTQNPAPAPAVSDDIQLAALLLKDNEIKTKAVKSLLGSGSGDTDYWELLITHGDKILGAFGQMIKGTIESAVTGIQQIKAQQNGAPPTNGIPTHAAIAPAIPAAQDADSTYQTTMAKLIDLLRENAPVQEAIKAVDGFVFLHPAYRDSIEMQLGADADAILAAIASLPGGPELVALPHAKTWLENFQTEFFSEQPEEGDKANES